MQPRVDEVGRQVFGVRPFSGGIGDDQRNLLVPQHVDERLMAHFERMP
jgi:hypothetical protein